MAIPLLMKVGLFAVGLVVGGGVVYGVVKATEKSSDDDTTTTTMSSTTMSTMKATTMSTMTTESPKQNSTGTRAFDSLKFLVFVSRHGNRGALTSSADYPEDPYPLSNSTYWPYGVSMLTTYGRLQAYKLGVKIRALYNGFLPSLWSGDDIYPTSDNTNRVILSGMMFLAGLYPPTGYQVWNDDLLWQPIILNTDSPDKSNSVMQCQAVQTDKATAWSEFQEEDAANISALVTYINETFGETYSASQLYNLFEKLISEELEGFTLPEWTEKIYPEALTDFYGKAFVAKNSGTDRVSRLYAGTMLDEIISVWKKVKSGTSSRLITFYSAHDSTVSNMQVCLGVSRSDMVKAVKPGSGLIIELHQDNSTSQYYIQVLYMDGTSADLEPQMLPLSNCGDPCYYDSFINSTTNFTGVSFSTECSA